MLRNQTNFKDFEMNTITQIYCPNCGSHAERHYLRPSQLIRTQCAACDYLMITCSETGRVIEAYAPGLYPIVKTLRVSIDQAIAS